MKQQNRAEAAWVSRVRRRLTIGSQVVVTVLLAITAVILLNAVAWRVPYSLELDVGTRHRLSEKTEKMLATTKGDVDVIAVLNPDKKLYDDVRNILMEYEHTAQTLGGLHVSLEWVNPDRDISRAHQLAGQYELESGDQIIFRSGENYRVINVGELARYEYELRDSGVSRRMVGFLGEQAFSSAILAVASQKAPVVYFLTGHGERDIDNFDHEEGYSSLARAISRDHFDVRTLFMPERNGVPADCDVLVIAGPEQQMMDEDLRWISDYLTKRRGRMLLLLNADPENQNEGLLDILEKWKIRPTDGYVTGTRIPGWGLVIHQYGDHPITRPMRNVASAFFAPRPLIPLDDAAEKAQESSKAAEDQVRLSVLARADENGWIEKDYEQVPAVFNDESDIRGPIPIAIAAELGPVNPDAQLQTTRIVVIGDSHFVSNVAISRGVSGNVSLIMSSLNWLAERDGLLSIEPNVPFALQPGMTQAQWRKVSLMVVFAVPGMMVIWGLLVGYQRKR